MKCPICGLDYFDNTENLDNCEHFSKDLIEEIERLKSENYISREDMLKSCEQCIYKTIIAQALEYINIYIDIKDEWNKFMVETLKKILEGERVE